jgi:hypothetical protein
VFDEEAVVPAERFAPQGRREAISASAAGDPLSTNRMNQTDRILDYAN